MVSASPLHIIVGSGACTPVGITAPASAAAVWAGISRISEHASIRDAKGEPVYAGMATAFLGEPSTLADRIFALCIPALVEAISPLMALEPGAFSLHVCLALPPPDRPGIRDPQLQQLEPLLSEILHGLTTRLSFSTSRMGHASGLVSLDASLRGQPAHEADFYLLGGVDSYIAPETLSWLEEQGRLLCSGNPQGFVPGEAAGFVLMASPKTAARFNLPQLARVLSTAATMEAREPDGQVQRMGQGLTHVLNSVLALHTEVHPVHHVFCDLNSESHRAEEYGLAAVRIGRRLAAPDEYCSPAITWGDVGAASAPLLLVLATHFATRGHLIQPYALVWTASDSGERAAALLQFTL